MKAMVIKDFGGIDVFEEKEVDKPIPGPTEVLVKVKATSVNPVDYKIRQNGKWAGITPPAVIGYDVSGVVEKTGELAEDLEEGDEVFYTPEIDGSGSYAAYHVANEKIVSHKPQNLSFEEAAAMPLAASTAWDALVTRGILQAGERVLIHGVGGVGHYAVQIAKATGAYVYAVCAEYDEEWAKELGADETIDYRNQDFAKILGENAVDMVFDTVGGTTLVDSVPVVGPYGRMISIVASEGDLDMAYHKNLTLHLLMLQRARYKLDYLANLAEWGKIKPQIDTVMPLTDVAKAHEMLEQGKVQGKIVLKVD